MKDDGLRRFLFVDKQIRGAHVQMAGAVKEIMQQHHYPPVIYTALAQCLVASTLLVTRLKFKGTLTLQLESGGTINLLVAKCNEKLEVRGMARWEDIADQQQLAVDFYSGRLVVTISPDNSSSQYQSIVDLGSGSLSRALEDYFLQSEQLPTVIIIDVSKRAANGLLLQRMPDADMDNLFWNESKKRLEAIEEDLSENTERLLKLYFSEEDIQLFESEFVEFACHCGFDKVENAVLSMGKAEADSILAEKPVIAITCEYCNQEYTLDRGQVDKLFYKS